MKTIWKFPLEVVDEQLVDMPEGSEILAVQVQLGVPCLWAAVTPDAAKVKRCIATYGTGHPMKSRAADQYVGSYQLQGGALVFHVYGDTTR